MSRFFRPTTEPAVVEVRLSVTEVARAGRVVRIGINGGPMCRRVAGGIVAICRCHWGHIINFPGGGQLPTMPRETLGYYANGDPIDNPGEPFPETEDLNYPTDDKLPPN